jgi:hypothetical protein
MSIQSFHQWGHGIKCTSSLDYILDWFNWVSFIVLNAATFIESHLKVICNQKRKQMVCFIGAFVEFFFPPGKNTQEL